MLEKLTKDIPKTEEWYAKIRQVTGSKPVTCLFSLSPCINCDIIQNMG